MSLLLLYDESFDIALKSLISFLYKWTLKNVKIVGQHFHKSYILLNIYGYD